MADAHVFRQAWSKFPTGVAVVTTIEPDGGVHGMAANGVNSVSLDPLLVLVCVDHRRNTYSLIRQGRRFGLNFLRREQRDVAEYYARPAQERTGDPPASFRLTTRGAAFLEGALASMDCKLVAEHPAGDHSIFVGEVEEVVVGQGDPLVFFEGRLVAPRCWD